MKPAVDPASATPSTTAVVFYFQVHQPYRLRHFSFFDIGSGGGWFNQAENERILRRVAERCYVPVTALLHDLVEDLEGAFRCSFSISGTALEQMERWAPEALEGFVRLARTGCVEFLAETSHHSLAALSSAREFEDQVEAHARKIGQLFGSRPTTFRNTELLISSDIARRIEDLGFRCLLGEGADQLLYWRSPHHVYRPKGCRNLKLLLRDYPLSDDIAFRFSNREWPEWPLTPERFARKLGQAREGDAFVGLFMDFETFGEHQWEPTGILAFLRALPRAVLASPRLSFATPSEVAAAHAPVADLELPRPISWADAERDLTAWLGNPMQSAAHAAALDLGARLRALPPGRAGELVADWRRLTTSDHFYYMCTKWFSDGDVHKYFSPYASPHDAFISYMNVLDDLERRLSEAERPAPAAVQSDGSNPQARARPKPKQRGSPRAGA